MENANSELVTKQRTQSIDRSLETGMPRSYSVDSVDYTTMLMGDMPEEVKEEARKRRRNRKPRRLWERADGLIFRDYSKVLGNGSTSGESKTQKKGQHINRHEGKKSKWTNRGTGLSLSGLCILVKRNMVLLLSLSIQVIQSISNYINGFKIHIMTVW